MPRKRTLSPTPKSAKRGGRITRKTTKQLAEVKSKSKRLKNLSATMNDPDFVPYYSRTKKEKNL